jgi:hypothetical protein
MHAAIQRTSVRIGVFVAITAVIAAGLFAIFRLAAIAPPGRSAPAKPAPHGFILALHGKSAKPKGHPTYESLDAEARRRIDATLETAHARYHVPEVMRLGHPNTVIFVVAPGAGANAALPGLPPGKSVPAEIKVVRGNPMHHVLVEMSAGDTDARVDPSAEHGDGKKELRPGESASWSWKVTPTEAGTLVLSASTFVTTDAHAEPFPYPVGQWEIPIELSFWDNVRQFLSGVDVVWAGLISVITGLASALTLFRAFGIKPFRQARRDQEGELVV